MDTRLRRKSRWETVHIGCKITAPLTPWRTDSLNGFQCATPKLTSDRDLTPDKWSCETSGTGRLIGREGPIKRRILNLEDPSTDVRRLRTRDTLVSHLRPKRGRVVGWSFPGIRGRRRRPPPIWSEGPHGQRSHEESRGGEDTDNGWRKR